VETKTSEAKNDEAHGMTLKTADKSKGCCLKLNFRELKVFMFICICREEVPLLEQLRI
jgi:hypothetical protein